MKTTNQEDTFKRHRGVELIEKQVRSGAAAALENEISGVSTPPNRYEVPLPRCKALS